MARSGTPTTPWAIAPLGCNSRRTGGTATTDRLQSAGTITYSVNANGNLVSRGADTFTYDQANRLKGATVGGATSTYTYDGDGKRVTKTVGITTTNYVYDANRALPVALDDGSRKYVWGVGLAYAVDRAGNVEVYYTDGLGSVRAVGDAPAQDDPF